MIRTRLQTFSTTSSTCELYRMVFPADAKAAIRSLIMMDAFTSSPESGSSSRMRSGSWRSAAAMRIFWRMPLEYVSRRLTRSDERSNVSSMQAIRDCSVSSATHRQHSAPILHGHHDPGNILLGRDRRQLIGSTHNRKPYQRPGKIRMRRASLDESDQASVQVASPVQFLGHGQG